MIKDIKDKFPEWRQMWLSGWKTRVCKQIAKCFNLAIFERTFKELELLENLTSEDNIIYPRYICFLAMLDKIGKEVGQDKVDELLKVIAI